MDSLVATQVQRFKQGLLVAKRRLSKALSAYEQEHNAFNFPDPMELEEDELFDVFELVTGTFDQLRKQVQLQWQP